LRALRRLTGNVRLAFDGDKAGIAATERAIPIASEVGIELTIITLPDGAKDPDELIQQDVSLWQQAIQDDQPAVEWILDQYAQREDITTGAGKRAFTTAALAIIASLKDPILREYYERKAAERVHSSVEAIKAKLANASQVQKKAALHDTTQVLGRKDPSDYVYQDNVLSLALFDIPSRELFAHIDPLIFVDEDRQILARYLAAHLSETLTETPPDLQKIDTYVNILLLKADTRYADWSDQDRLFETARLLRQVANEHKKQTQERLTNELREAENSDDDERAMKLRMQLNTLIKEITRGQR
jgi:DNA primase